MPNFGNAMLAVAFFRPTYKTNKMETIQSPTETKAIKDHKCDFCLGKIEKGSKYIKSVHKYDDIYSWKTHKQCSEIASKLKMYDHCDEGVTTDYFIETIKDEYSNLMSNNQNEKYESKDFVLPNFEGQLQFVISHYGVS